MNSSKATGLGEPEPIGKRSLFQPPGNMEKRAVQGIQKYMQISEMRVRMTLEITKNSLSIMQEWQSRYRLDTGHPLPKWKMIGEALELYEKTRKGEGSEK